MPNNTCDVPFCDNSPPLDISKDQFEDFSDSNDDSTSVDDDYFSIDAIDYVEASPQYSELVSLEEVEDDILREKLSKINLLIAKIESLNDNPTPDRMLNSSTSIPIFEESDNSLLDNSSPEFETFSDHTEETRSGSTTTYANNSLPEFDSFCFEIKPNSGEVILAVMNNIEEFNKDECFDPGGEINVLTNVEDDDYFPFIFVIRIFLPYLIYPEVSPLLLSTESEDTIFNPGISV
nr:hypothetical protein [Tanacetum cinerariifolium]